MTHHFTLAAVHGDMHTFTQWTENHRAIAYVRGFGKTEAAALQDAMKDFSAHAEHAAPAPYSHKERNF